jgi:hypothetical protein
MVNLQSVSLSPSIATGLVIECLAAAGKAVKRNDLAKYAEDRHRERGGAICRNSNTSMKKALHRLASEGKITRPAPGWYALTDGIVESGVPDEPELIASELTAGDGDEWVYVYFNESERRLAKHEGRSRWPCKVGYAPGSLTSRIWGQGIATSMARLPTVGLVIKTDDGYGLERALHFALDEADARIDEALGDEWFETSPQRILEWYRLHHQSIAALKPGLAGRLAAATGETGHQCKGAGLQAPL